jgi:hypothetical protein
MRTICKVAGSRPVTDVTTSTGLDGKVIETRSTWTQRALGRIGCAGASDHWPDSRPVGFSTVRNRLHRIDDFAASKHWREFPPSSCSSLRTQRLRVSILERISSQAWNWKRREAEIAEVGEQGPLLARGRIMLSGRWGGSLRWRLGLLALADRRLWTFTRCVSEGSICSNSATKNPC